MRTHLAPLGRLLFVDDALIGLVTRLLSARQRPWLTPLIDGMVRVFAGKSPEMLQAAPEIHNVLKGIPSDYFVRHAYFKSRMLKPEHAHPDRDRCGIIWFAPIVPMTGDHVTKVIDLMAPEFRADQFDFYAALLIQNPRSMIVLTAIFFDMESPEQTARAGALYERLSGLVATAGYQQYRVGTPGMAWLRDKNPGFMGLLDVIKTAVDPDGVIAPGKYGIRGRG
jgi:4-cresol dehydrogenase (hydroxylating)